MSVFSLFQIVDRAKDLGNFPVANLAFAVLADAALDREKELHFIWEKSPGNDEDEIYYDLLVVSDGLRSACIPAPLLKNPLVFRSLCKKEIEKHNHNRSIDPELLEVEDIKEELASLVRKILSIAPNAQALANKYLASKECQVCPFFAAGHDEGAIHCTVHPFAYPEGMCGDWEVNLDDSGFQEKVDSLGNLVMGYEEKTRETRKIFLRSNTKWSNNLWFKKGDEKWEGYVLHKCCDDEFHAVEYNDHPNWNFYLIKRQLRSLNERETRWLITRDKSPLFNEIWVIKTKK